MFIAETHNLMMLISGFLLGNLRTSMLNLVTLHFGYHFRCQSVVVIAYCHVVVMVIAFPKPLFQLIYNNISDRFIFFINLWQKK